MSGLIVYAGPNGSGKSTLRDIAGDVVDVTIDPDRIARGIDPSNPGSRDIDAGREALRQFAAAMGQGLSMSLETTLTGNTVLGRMARAKAAGYEVSLFYVALIDVSRNIARVATRAANGGHFIPEETIRRRVPASQDNLAAALRIADHGDVFDNSGPVLTRLLTVDGRRIVFAAAEMPDWLGTRMPGIEAALGR